MSFGENWPTSLFFPNEFPILFLFCCLLLGTHYFIVQTLICYQTGPCFYPNSGPLFCKAELWIGVPVWLIQSWFPISHGLTVGNTNTKLAGLSLASLGITLHEAFRIPSWIPYIWLLITNAVPQLLIFCIGRQAMLFEIQMTCCRLWEV